MPKTSVPVAVLKLGDPVLRGTFVAVAAEPAAFKLDGALPELTGTGAVPIGAVP